MQRRISAGVIVERLGCVLLVRYHRPGGRDYWVAPGGGVHGVEDLRAAAARECREETAVDVEPGALLCIEDLLEPTVRHCKFWCRDRYLGGEPSAAGPDARAEGIVEAAWLSRDDLRGKTVYPPMLASRRWERRLGRGTGPLLFGPRAIETA
jgi:ADP-ribose pyrophosphatase YjhB (NUDIX family)